MIRLRRLGARTLDLELSTARGVTLRILERPGRWLSVVDRRRLLDEMRTLARESVGGEPLEYGILSGDPERWHRAILTLVRETGTGRLVGFSAMALLDARVCGRSEDVLHLGLVVLDPACRGRGFSRLLYCLTTALLLARRAGRSFWVSSVTQVPAIVGMVARSLDGAYPGGIARPSDAHRQVAREIMARHRAAFGVADEAGFDAERFVITDAYTGGSDNLKKTLAEAPRHRDEDINQLCARELDYARGDDFLQIARFTPRVAWGCVRAFLERRSRPSSVARGLAVAGRRP